MNGLRVLVTGAGGPGMPGTAYTLRRHGATVLGTDLDPDTPGQYLCDTFAWGLPPENVDFRSRLWDIVARERVDVILPQCTRELMPLAEWKDPPCPIMVAHPDALVLAGSKRWVMGAATLRYRPQHLRSARWVGKPDRESGKRGFVEIPKDVVLMEHLPGAEYSVDCFRDRAVVRRRLAGTGGASTVCETVLEPGLEQETLRIGREAGLTGLYGVQFKETAAGEPKVIDCNPRIMGSQVCTELAGVPMLAAAVAEALGWEVPTLPPPRIGVRYVRTRGGFVNDGTITKI